MIRRKFQYYSKKHTSTKDGKCAVRTSIFSRGAGLADGLLAELLDGLVVEDAPVLDLAKALLAGIGGERRSIEEF